MCEIYSGKSCILLPFILENDMKDKQVHETVHYAF